MIDTEFKTFWRLLNETLALFEESPAEMRTARDAYDALGASRWYEAAEVIVAERKAA